MTIDPGIVGTGVAIWNQNGSLHSYRTISSKEKDWMQAAKDISNNSVFITDDYEFIAFEMPSNFESSTASIAAGKRGDILKLSILIGMIIKESVHVSNHIPVLVQSWKGNTKKELMNDRTVKIFNADRDQAFLISRESESSHVLDAIGIGLYLQGKL